MRDTPTLTSATDRLRAAIAEAGYARLPSAQSLALLNRTVADWNGFAESWDHLGPDLFMADGGRYRRRRHAAFRCQDGRCVRKPHQPHYQSRDYNPLNGDVQRWFDPVDPAIAEGPVLQAIFALCAKVFAQGDTRARHVEMHQFRIEAKPDQPGLPTPEGLHRDGVDHVLVMLIRRENVREGVTMIGAPDGRALGAFMLAEPGDAVLLDDRRILHGVTEIHALDPSRPAWRDALVVTFASED